jgi:hypothetical protein
MKKTILALALVAGLTSFAGSAKAAIITANLNQTTTGSGYIGFGFNNGEINSDFNYGIDGSWRASENMLGRITPASGSIGFMNGQSAGNGYFNGSNKPLSYGTLIGESLSYHTSGRGNIGVNFSSGQYWAVKFNQGNGNFNYGWVQVDVTDSGMTFGMAAVNTTLNESITAGQITAVPEPSTYALFGIGALGLLMVVRRNKKA